MTEQNITLLVHTDTGTFFGILPLPSRMRLFDFINLSAQFLHLTGTVMIETNEAINNLSEIHINKEAIKILTTVVDDEGRGASAREKVYQFVQKKPVSVKIYMTDYEISGNLHSLEEVSLSHLVEKNLLFLPCTEVNIRNVRNNKSWYASFAALNKNNICVLEKVGSPL